MFTRPFVRTFYRVSKDFCRTFLPYCSIQMKSDVISFQGEMGPEGLRGLPGGPGSKGAKVERPILLDEGMPGQR